MSEILHPELEPRLGDLGQQFQGAPIFPHVLIENFFEPSFCRRLLEEFPGFDPEAKDEIGHAGQKATREDVRRLGEAYRQVDDLLQQPDFLGKISQITGIPDLLYDPDYVGGGTHDNVDGAELDIHVDFNYHPRRGWHRRLNLIVFLNPQWRREWGGCFEVHRDPWSGDDQSKSYVPAWNHAVIFETSERSWHGFDQVKLPPEHRDLSRKSFAVYLYTRERPAAEVAPSHATVYVPRPLPEFVQAGYTLGADDALELQKLYRRRTDHLKFLYEREKEAAEMIASLELQLRALESEALGLLRSVGPIEQRGGVQGAWPDQWMGGKVEVRLKATEAVKSLTVEGNLPSPDGAPRRLRARWAGESFELEGAGPFAWTLQAPLAKHEETVLEISAEQTWQPSATGSGGDVRQLAFHFGRLVAEPA